MIFFPMPQKAAIGLPASVPSSAIAPEADCNPRGAWLHSTHNADGACFRTIALIRLGRCGPKPERQPQGRFA